MSETTAPIRIDFVSDVSCPWCAIGLPALEQAIARVGEDASVVLHFQPFALNPALAAEGEVAIEHPTAQYGMSDQIGRASGRERVLLFRVGTGGRSSNKKKIIINNC